jgi:hypothetical protein
VVVTTPQTGEGNRIVGGSSRSYRRLQSRARHEAPDRFTAKAAGCISPALQTGQYTPLSVVDDEPIELKLDNGDAVEAGQITITRSTAGHAAARAARSRTTWRP